MQKTKIITKNIVIVLIGALIIYLSTKLSLQLPGTPVPQTAQTLMVIILAAVLPGYLGVSSVLIYLLAGAIGLPVFHSGGSGFDELIDATSGYLHGFIIAALFVSYCIKRIMVKKEHINWLSYGLKVLLYMLIAHILILTSGYIVLSLNIGFERAFNGGVKPFVVGGIIKSLLAAAVVVYYRQRRFIAKEFS